MSGGAPLWVCDWGCRDYEEIRNLQERLVAARRAELIPDVLLLGSHPPVVTAGRATCAAERELARPALAAAGIPLREAERGGRLTYHGPGQLIGYPLLRLEGPERDLHAYQHRLEGVLIAALTGLGVAAERREGFPGVWVGGAKLASLGIAVRGWVTWHGFALNLGGDLTPFGLFDPCGITGVRVTSLAQLGYPEHDRAQLLRRVVAVFQEVFGRTGVIRRIEDLESRPGQGTFPDLACQ
ncbi:MAG TPA: lipoyl(octanoyl) transferase LipB [Armatimonadota bacterium]|jgi:lipoate-protein ligase B